MKKQSERRTQEISVDELEQVAGGYWAMDALGALVAVIHAGGRALA